MSYDFLKLLICIVTILASFVYSTHAQTAPTAKAAATVLFAKGEIEGAWKLNVEQSDDVTAKVAAMMVTKPEQAARISANPDEMPAISISFYHPESVILAAGGNSETTINQFYSDSVQTRTVITDGAVRYYEISPGINLSVTAAKRNGVLRVETISPRGNKMIETFAPASGGKLNVSMRIETSLGQEIITMHRVYDRTILDIFSAGDDENQ